MFGPLILSFFIVSLVLVEGEKEIIFEVETSTNKSDNTTLLCYLKCKSDDPEVNGTIFLHTVNIFQEEKLFTVDGNIRNLILECMESNLSTEPCGEQYSRCKPLISKWSNASDDNTECCIKESFLDMSTLDWVNFLGFPTGVNCLMKCIKARRSIFDKKGQAEALNVYINTEFVDIIPEKKRVFRRCVLNGSGVHTCKEIMHLYVCFFRNMKRADSREWLYN